MQLQKQFSKIEGLDDNGDNLMVMIVMADYGEAEVELTNLELNKLKIKTWIKLRITWIKLRITNKNFQDEELSHELFLTTRQKFKIKIAFAKNIWKAPISNTIQSGASFASWLGDLGQ